MLFCADSSRATSNHVRQLPVVWADAAPAASFIAENLSGRSTAVPRACFSWEMGSASAGVLLLVLPSPKLIAKASTDPSMYLLPQAAWDAGSLEHISSRSECEPALRAGAAASMRSVDVNPKRDTPVTLPHLSASCSIRAPLAVHESNTAAAISI